MRRWQTGSMVTLLLDSKSLEIVLSPAERALAVRRDNVRIDRDLVEKVQLTDDPWTWLRGVRSPGTYVPGVIAAGTWRSIAGTDFAVIRRRRPGVVIDLVHDAPFQRIVLTTRHGLELVKAMRLDVPSTPTDVIDIVTPEQAAPSGRKRATAPKVQPAT